MSLLADHRDALPQHHLRFFAGSSVVVQHPIYMAFFDRTVDDALGPSRGRASRLRSAQDACHPLLKRLFHRMLPTSPRQRLDIARALYSGLGLGHLSIDVTADGGQVEARNLYRLSLEPATTGSPERPWPLDAFAGGFAAAATEVAYDLAAGTISVVPRDLGATTSYQLEAMGTPGEVRVPHQAQIRESAPASFGGLHEDRIAELTIGLLTQVSSFTGDEQGEIRPLGGRIAFVPSDYFNALAHHLLSTVAEEKPAALPAAKALLVESGYAHAYVGFGQVMQAGALQSNEHGANPLYVVLSALAIARAWGFGRWCVEAFVPEERLILRSPGTHESLYQSCAVDNAEPSAFAFEGAALAFMDLAHRTAWQNRPPLDGRMVTALRRDPRWQAQQTHSVAVGDAMDRVVVSVAPPLS